MAQLAGERAVEAVAAVDPSVLPFFRAAAAKLLESVGSAEDALAMALAKLTGHVEMKPRSLLTAHEDFTTLQFVSPYPVDKPGQVRWAVWGGGVVVMRWVEGMAGGWWGWVVGTGLAGGQRAGWLAGGRARQRRLLQRPPCLLLSCSPPPHRPPLLSSPTGVRLPAQAHP